MPYATDFNNAQDPDFRNRSIVALTAAAIAVIGEAQGGMTVTKLDKRHQYAMRVMENPALFADKVAFLLAASGVTPAATDTTLLNTITSGWNKLAGVKITD